MQGRYRLFPSLPKEEKRPKGQWLWFACGWGPGGRRAGRAEGVCLVESGTLGRIIKDLFVLAGLQLMRLIEV